TLTMSDWLGKDATSVIFSYHGGIRASGEIQPKGAPHAQIHINGNDEFANQALKDGWPGDGSQNNPYIIDGYDIDAHGGSYGIWIENTDVYFVICNCTVYNATNYDSAPYAAGIALNNVIHGTLENNTCNNSRYGIYLYGGSQYNNLTNNNASANSYRGIWLDSSSNNTITNNNASDNTDSGIYLYSSSNNGIINNTASGNYYGISLEDSSNNSITNNNASGNKYGIYLGSKSNSNSITNNNASGNSWYGIYLGSSSNNNITNNEASGNSYYGIWLDSSSNNNITNNNASANSYGIYLGSSSNNNIITYNWICNNANYGVYITGSSTGNIIHHNNFIANNGAGKGVSGNCQAYDDAGGNYWYDNTVQEGNYWSNWDGNGWGTADAYPIDGGKASDWYPLSETTQLPLFAVLLLGALVAIARKRKH
ncbi:MAG: NosD domain-containing protein, partial [Thermoplasmata archaeon]